MRAVWVLLACAACAPAQTVQGTIVNAVTGGGIPGAKLVLSRNREAQYSGTADDQGRFRIDGVTPGVYTARYAAERYFSAMPPGAGPQVQVAASDVPVRLEARLIPCAQVSGRVIDGRGDPVPKARVDITSASAFWSAQTDGRGNFT